jgi:uridine kinase
VTPARRAVLDRVAEAVLALPATGTVRVGIDGVDGAGKTTIADELRDRLAPTGRPVIRASVDGFHHPKPVRYRLGRHSPEGFYRDSYDYAALRRLLLDPLGPGGTGRFRRAIFDVDADVAVDAPEERAAPGSILLLDGMFLHRRELRDAWDLSVFLRVEWTRNHRLRGATGTPARADLEAPATRRYQDGQRLYFRECAPWEYASIVVDNDDLAAPFVVERGDRRGRLAAWLVLLLLAVATPALAQQGPLTFAGLGLRSDVAAVEARYPRSPRVGNYVYVAPEESHDHIYGIELSGVEPGRRLRVTFERPDGVPSPDGSGRYPTCASVQRLIERANGSPASIVEFAEEASWRADRVWRRGLEELRLICFGERNRPASLQAEGVVIVPLDR